MEHKPPFVNAWACFRSWPRHMWLESKHSFLAGSIIKCCHGEKPPGRLACAHCGKEVGLYLPLKPACWESDCPLTTCITEIVFVVAFLTTRMRSVICTSSPALGPWEFPHWEVKLTQVLFESASESPCRRQSPQSSPALPRASVSCRTHPADPTWYFVPGLTEAQKAAMASCPCWLPIRAAWLLGIQSPSCCPGFVLHLSAKI